MAAIHDGTSSEFFPSNDNAIHYESLLHMWLLLIPRFTCNSSLQGSPSVPQFQELMFAPIPEVQLMYESMINKSIANKKILGVIVNCMHCLFTLLFAARSRLLRNVRTCRHVCTHFLATELAHRPWFHLPT